MARTAETPEKPKLKTLAVSPDFAVMINELAKAKGLTVREYCDRHGAPKFAPDYDRLTAAKREKVAALGRKGA
jgi:hypothetical protein